MSSVTYLRKRENFCIIYSTLEQLVAVDGIAAGVALQGASQCTNPVGCTADRSFFKKPNELSDQSLHTIIGRNTKCIHLAIVSGGWATANTAGAACACGDTN